MYYCAMGTIISTSILTMIGVALGSAIAIFAMRVGAKGQAYKDAGLSPPPSTIENLIDRILNRTRPEDHPASGEDGKPSDAPKDRL